MRTSPAGESEAGFSLVELLVVLVLLGFGFALFAPMLAPGSGARALRQAARQLAAELRLARSEALAGATERTLLIDVDARRYGMAPGPYDGRLPEDATVSLLTAESEVESSRVGGIRFFPDGTSTGGGVTLSTGRARYEVAVDWLTGRVEVGDAR